MRGAREELDTGVTTEGSCRRKREREKERENIVYRYTE